MAASLVWYGHTQAAPDRRFLGFVGPFPGDYLSYIAWIGQARDGQLLFRDLYTSEPHAADVLLPLFWLMGTSARLTGASIMTTWYVTHALGCALMVSGIYRLGAEFVATRSTRVLALVLATTASGFGWLTEVGRDTPWHERPIDLWMPEATQFQTVALSFFTLSIALGLMLWAMVAALRYLDGGRWRDAVYAGLLTCLVAAVHPYDIVTLGSVLALWTIMAGPRRFAGMLLVAALAAPPTLYGGLTALAHPIFSQVRWEMTVPPLRAHVIGWGLPLLIALVALATPAVWRRHRGVGRLLAWLLVSVGLVLVPLGFQRKLVWGAHVAMCLLTAMLVDGVLGARVETRGGARLRAVLAALVVIACGAGSVAYYQGLRAGLARQPFAAYPPEGLLDAAAWLEEHTHPDDVVAAAPEMAGLVPALTGATVFAGHWAQTIDYRAKAELTLGLFWPARAGDTERVRRILARNRVRYAVLDGRTVRRYGLGASPGRYLVATLGVPVYERGGVLIWELDGYVRRSATEPWPDGDWRG